jgi:D-alanine-D-alanine ligase
VKVAVLAGGHSSEHSISLLSARSVADVLTQSGHQVSLIGINKEGVWTRLAAIPKRDGHSLPVLPHSDTADFANQFGECAAEIRTCDVTFPVLHGPFGEDGTVQGLLELLGVAYVGSGVLASAACMDKPTTKARLESAGIPIPDFTFFELDDDSNGSITEAVAFVAESNLGFPMFVKPARGGSSVGMTRVPTAAQLFQAISEASQHDLRIIFEQAIENMREIECGVLARPNHAQPDHAQPSQAKLIPSVPSEIKVKPPRLFYDFEAKYLDDSADLLVPAQLDAAITAEIQNMSLQVFDVMGCEGLARIDFFLRGTEVLVSEVNTMPGFTEISMFPRMFEATGISYPQLVDDLVHAAKSRTSR